MKEEKEEKNLKILHTMRWTKVSNLKMDKVEFIAKSMWIYK